MFLSQFPISLPQTFACILCLYITHFTYRQLTTGARLRRFAVGKGCLPVKRIKVKDPFFGLDFLWTVYKAAKDHKLLELSQKHFADTGANTVGLKLLHDSVIATIEPENIKSVLSTDFKSYSLGDNRKRLMTPLLGEGIFTTDGAAWQHSRDMLRPNFVRTQIGDIDMFEPHIQNVIRAIPRDGEMIDLHDVFFSMSLDIASEFLFGESTGMLSEEVNAETEAFVRAFSYCQSVMEGMEGEWGFLSLFVPDRRVKGEIKTVHGNLKFYFPLGIGFESAFRTHVQILTDFVDSLVEKALKNQDKYESSKSQNPDHRYIFLHELCSQTTSKPKIRSELLNILLAGRDTTASLLSNLWFQLSKSPTLWSKLQSEISTLNGSFPSFEELKELKFLRTVLNESLRLHPVVPENGRQAERDTTLPLGGGQDGKAPVVVRKGQLVAYSLWTMHRRKDLFGEDAEVFRPERWLDGEEGKGLRVGWEYLPFNGGPRICIGQQFALTEAAYVTVRMMQEFEGIESKDPEPWREKLRLTCSGLGGCKVVLTPRA